MPKIITGEIFLLSGSVRRIIIQCQPEFKDYSHILFPECLQFTGRFVILKN